MNFFFHFFLVVEINIKIEASHNLWTTNNILSTSNTQNVLNRTNFNLRGHKNDVITIFIF